MYKARTKQELTSDIKLYVYDADFTMYVTAHNLYLVEKRDALLKNGQISTHLHIQVKKKKERC
jgi:hypothetical protein